MVFGRFQGDKRLDAQKKGLHETLDQLAEVQRQIGDTTLLQAGFAEVWDGVPDDLRLTVGKARELADLLDERMAMARHELPNFDEAAAFLKTQTEGLTQRWRAFVTLLMARQTIAQGEIRSVPATRSASTMDCQRALIEIAGDLRDALRTHLDELTIVKAEHSRPWPELLDLPAMARTVADVDSALDIYSQRLRDEGELIEASTVSLMDIIAMLQARVATIEDQRVDLAADLMISTVMRNTGLRA